MLLSQIEGVTPQKEERHHRGEMSYYPISLSYYAMSMLISLQPVWNFESMSVFR